MKLEEPEHLHANEQEMLRADLWRSSMHSDSEDYNEDQTLRFEKERQNLIYKKKEKKEWPQLFMDYLKEHFGNFNLLVRLNYKSGKVEYCILFSELNLCKKEFRMDNDRIVFKIELKDLDKLRDTKNVKINNQNANWSKKNGHFNFLCLESNCCFKEFPKFLKLGPSDFKFQTTCKEFI